MVTKGIVEKVINQYSAKVRLPLYDGVSSTKNSISTDNLPIATICTLPNTVGIISEGDIVFVTFEDNDKSKRVILGVLSRETKSISYPTTELSTIKIYDNATLPVNTTIGNLSSNDIACLIGLKDNIQRQIDALQAQLDSISNP